MDRHHVDTRRNSSSFTDVRLLFAFYNVQLLHFFFQYEINSSAEGETTCSEEEYAVSRSSNSVNSEPMTHYTSPLYHNSTWPVERTMWNSEPAKSESPDLHATRHLVICQRDSTLFLKLFCFVYLGYN